MNIAEYVVAEPDVMMGKPVIRGTRITVEFILEKLAAPTRFAVPCDGTR